MGIGKSAVDVSTQTQVYAVSNGDITNISEPNEVVGVVKVDASSQTGHFAASESRPCYTSRSETSSHVKRVGLVNNHSSDTLASEGRRGKCQSEVEGKTSEDDFADSSPSGTLASEATLVDNPSGSLSPSMIQQGPSQEDHVLINASVGGQEDIYISGRQISPFEKTGSVVQDVDEINSSVEPSGIVLKQSLVTERSAHQQTREELARLEDWCKRLEAENTELQTRAEHVERENARIQRQLVIVEDESVGYQTELSNAEAQIRNLMNSNEIYISTIEELRRQEVDLNGEIAWYLQLGVGFCGRLQKAEQFLNPHDKCFAYYQRLVGDAAQLFSIPTEAGDENKEIHGHAVRVEEIDDTGHEGKEDDQESGGSSILDTNNTTSDHLPTNEADAGEPEAHVAAINDDEVPCADRPMRPGTANRVPISVFTSNNGDASNGRPSSIFGDFAQQVRSPATSAFPISFDFSEHSAQPDEKSGTSAAPEAAPITKAPKSSARSKTGKGGIYSSGESRRHGANRPRGSPRGGGDEDVFLGEAVSNTNCGVDSSPPATAFPINFGFSETSLKTEGKREANSSAVFGH